MVEINVPENVNFLNEWVGFELPKGIFNKGVTGCGATTLAIEDKHKTIICSPRINLIKNKKDQYEGLLVVTGDVRSSVISSYLETSKKPKIFVTYDSFPRLCGIIGDKSGWRVVVDEYHYLLIDSSFKSDTEMKLLDSLDQFDYVTYLSATPIADKYMKQIDHFKDMPYTTLKWSNVEKPEIRRVVSSRPINNAIEIVRNYKKGIFPKIGDIESRECVIFLNSVTNIVNIIKQIDLKPEEVNIIVGTSEINSDFVKKLGNGFGIGSIPLEGEPHKMFTFCTSTAFAGCDFYSTCASTFVISDNRKVHTSIDIATELVQIAGRQRLDSNPFRKTVTFIYNVDIGEKDRSGYERFLKEKWNLSNRFAACKNGITDEAVKEMEIRQIEESQRLNKYRDHYVNYDHSKELFLPNRLAYLNDRFSFDVQHENYANGFVVKKQLDASGFNTDEPEIMSDYWEQVRCIITKESFADRMKRYCGYRLAKEENFFFIADEVMERQYDDFKMYYDTLGAERIKALGYKESNLKNEIKNRSLKNEIWQRFRDAFKVGDRLTTSDIKKTMLNIYSEYGIKKNGVCVTSLEKMFGIGYRSVKIPMSNGSRKNGYEFI
ncbi:MAG: hypothetical protein K2G52_12785 [Muribaculaceae bacterium]|nr:hypothetical protein [Muribaculaceae bacterium]